MFTSLVLNIWKKENMNYTNFEKIQIEHFQMHILMNAYLLIIIINIFFVELSGWGYRHFIQSWGTDEWTGSRFIKCVFFYLAFLVYSHVIPLISSPISKEQYRKVKEKLLIIFLISIEYL